MCWMEWTGTSHFEAWVSKQRLCPISLNWNVITSPSNLLIEQHLYNGWKKCLSCLLFRYWSKKPAYYLVLYIPFLAEVIQTYSFWISQTFLKVCNKSLIFGFRLGQAFRFLLFICKLLACFLQFVFQGFLLFGELQQSQKTLSPDIKPKKEWSYQLIVQLRVEEQPLRTCEKMLEFPSNCMLDCRVIEEFTGHAGLCLHILPIIIGQMNTDMTKYVTNHAFYPCSCEILRSRG